MKSEIPAYLCKIATNFKFDIVMWDDGKSHEEPFRKIKLTCDTVPPSKEEIEYCKINNYIETYKPSILNISTSTDFTKIVEALVSKKNNEIVTIIMDMDANHISDTEGDDENEHTASSLIYMENLELVIHQISTSADVKDCWVIRGELLTQLLDEIVTLNSKLSLGVIL